MGVHPSFLIKHMPLPIEAVDGNHDIVPRYPDQDMHDVSGLEDGGGGTMAWAV